MSYRLGTTKCPISLWWVAYYHHCDVLRLFDEIRNVECLEEVAAEPGASVEDLGIAASVLDECQVYDGGYQFGRPSLRFDLAALIMKDCLASLRLLITLEEYKVRGSATYNTQHSDIYMVELATFADRGDILSFLLSQKSFPGFESSEIVLPLKLRYRPRAWLVSEHYYTLNIFSRTGKIYSYRSSTPESVGSTFCGQGCAGRLHAVGSSGSVATRDLATTDMYH